VDGLPVVAEIELSTNGVTPLLPVKKKIAAPVDVKYKVPPCHCAKARLELVVTVAVPAVIVVVPAPMF
jgi:hypothetical protein